MRGSLGQPLYRTDASEGVRNETLLLVSGTMFGGGQRVVMDLWRQCKEQGANVTVVTLGSEACQLDICEPIRIKYDGRYNTFKTLFRTAWRLRRVLRDRRPKNLHTHGWDADVIGALARLGCGVKQVVHLHVTPEWLSSNTARHRFRRWVSKWALTAGDSEILAVSNAVREHWTACIGELLPVVQVVHNGVDVSKYLPVAEKGCNQQTVIGVAARLVPMKGIEYLIDSLCLMNRNEFQWILHVAGDGGSRADLERSVSKNGLSNRIRFLGHLDDIERFYRSLDIYVQPSISTEGLPLTILEAMASGLPVVATTVGGSPEAIRDGIDGFLVPPRDPEGLRQALERLLRDGVLRQSMGQNARQRVTELFSLERCARRVMAVYQ